MNGSFVSFGKSVGYAYRMYSGASHFSVCPYLLDEDGSSISIMPFTLYRDRMEFGIATDEEREKLLRAVWENGYAIMDDGELAEVYKPSVGDIAVLMTDDMDISGMVESYSYEQGSLLTLDYNGRIHRYTFDPRKFMMRRASATHGKKVAYDLRNAGFMWDGSRNRVVGRHPRAFGGYMYWSITDRLDIRCQQDNGTLKDREKYDSGNYFFLREDAVRLVRLIEQFNLDRYAEEESGLWIESTAL